MERSEPSHYLPNLAERETRILNSKELKTANYLSDDF
jgi:hypothetical protein